MLFCVFLSCLQSLPGKDKGDSLRNAAADFEGTEVFFSFWHMQLEIEQIKIKSFVSKNSQAHVLNIYRPF